VQFIASFGAIMAGSKSMPVFEMELEDIGVTICSVCGGNEEEDLVLLCDGKGCTNEIHMYCLKPLVTAVPDGDWYCPMCDVNGTTAYLEDMLQSHERTFKNELLVSKEEYELYLTLLQQKYYPFEVWRPNALECRVPSEFDVSSLQLLGMPLKLYSEVEDQIHTGRIISCRHDEELGRWLHLVQFRR
jgi:PHD-finger